jgi:hypothetical protein
MIFLIYFIMPFKCTVPTNGGMNIDDNEGHGHNCSVFEGIISASAHR